MSFFGDLKRIFVEPYPYRWPIAIGELIVLAGVLAFSYHMGW